MIPPDKIVINYPKPKESGLETLQVDPFPIVASGKLSLLHKAFEESTTAEITNYIEARDVGGRTILHYSSYLDLQNLSLYILSYGANPFTVDNDGQNCFHSIAFKGNINAALLILNYKMHELKKTLFEALIRMKNTFGMSTVNLQNTVNTMLTASYEADLKILESKTFFNVELEKHLAEYFTGICDIYRYILSQYDINQRNPLHYAALSKFSWCSKTLETLIDCKNLEGHDKFLDTFDKIQELEWKPERKIDPRRYMNVIDEIKRILPPQVFQQSYKKFQSDFKAIVRTAINTQDKNGHTPLHIAAYSGDCNIVKVLIKKGADKSLLDIDGKTALFLSSTKLVMKYLSSLEETTIQGNTNAFMHLIRSGYNVNISNTEFLVSSVHKAVSKEKQVLEAVLQCQADPNIHEWNMYTPLHYACISGSLENAETLISQNYDVNAVSQNYYTPLHLAAKHNHPSLINLLLERGAKINAKDENKRTPLMIAAKYGSLDSVKVLLNSADLYEIDIRKWTCLHYACFHKQVKVVSELVAWDIDHGKLVAMKNTQNKLAIEITSDVATRDAFNTMWTAAATGDLDMARRLLRRGDEPFKPSAHDYCTPLIFAVKAFEKFKQKKEKENKQIKDVGKLALQKNKSSKEIEDFKRKQILMIKFLLDLGARTEELDRLGKSALDYTNDEKLKEVLTRVAGVEGNQASTGIRTDNYRTESSIGAQEYGHNLSSKYDTQDKNPLRPTTGQDYQEKNVKKPVSILEDKHTLNAPTYESYSKSTPRQEEKSNFDKLAKAAHDEYDDDFEKEDDKPKARHALADPSQKHQSDFNQAKSPTYEDPSKRNVRQDNFSSSNSSYQDPFARARNTANETSTTGTKSDFPHLKKSILIDKDSDF